MRTATNAASAAVLLGLVAAPGCGVVYPGDGQLVAVSVAPELAAHTVMIFTGKTSTSTATLGELAREGTHYWDAVGARLRTVDEIGDEVPAATIHVERADAFTAAFAGDHSGYYDPIAGKVYLFMSSYYDENFAENIATTFAHELGHALGLDHVDAAAVMHPGESWPTLQPADMQQFADASR